MKKMFFVLFAMLIIALPNMRQASAQMPESLSFTMPEGIEPKFVQDYNYGSVIVTRFVLQGNSIDDWTEIFEIVNGLTINYPGTPKALYLNTIDKRKKRCSDSRFTIINENENSIIYEIIAKQCPSMPDEHSLNKVMYGNTNVFTLIYTNRNLKMSQKTRNNWLKVLSKAAIVQ